MIPANTPDSAWDGRVGLPTAAGMDNVHIIHRGDVLTLLSGSVGLPDASRAVDELCRLLVPLVGDGLTVQPRQPISTWTRDAAYRTGDYIYLHADRLQEVIEVLQATGCFVEQHDYDDWPQYDHVASDDMLQGLAAYQWHLLGAVQDHLRAQISTSPGEIPDLLAALATYLPRKNMLVIAKNRDSAHRFAQHLRQHTSRRISTDEPIPWHAQPLVRIECLSGIDRTSSDWGVLVFADLESAVSATGLRQAVSMPEALIYTLVDIHRRLDWEDRLRLRVVSGAEIYRLDDRPFVPTEVSVVTVRAKKTNCKLVRNPLANKQRQIWRNPQRNKQTAEIATALVQRDQVTLDSHGIDVTAILELLDRAQPPRVAILVESPQHARVLRKLLPDWSICSGARYAAPDCPTLPIDREQVIVTRTRAVAAGLAADVVIRADGTGTAWDAAYGPHYGFHGSRMLIIDVQDQYDRQVRRWAGQRVEDYIARGWTVTDGGSGRGGQWPVRAWGSVAGSR